LCCLVNFALYKWTWCLMILTVFERVNSTDTA
jgi:hypothetical protein